MKHILTLTALALLTLTGFTQTLTLAPTINGPCAPGGVVPLHSVNNIATYPAVCVDDQDTWCGIILKCANAHVKFRYNQTYVLPYFGAVEISRWFLVPHTAGHATELFIYVDHQGIRHTAPLSFYVE